MRRVLYLTYDGLLDPLGTSQVLRPVLELAKRGVPYAVVSLEKAARLADQEKHRALRHLLRDAGVPWVFAPYLDAGSGRGARNAATLFELARQAIRRHDVGLLHARSHPPTAIAWALKKATGQRYLFDFRGFWLEERQLAAGALSRPDVFAAAKRVERRLVADASAAVTLTDLASGDFRAEVLGRWPSGRPVETITTVADFNEFRREGPVDAVPPDVRERLRGKLVVAYCGSINPFYELRASLDLVAKLRRLRPDTHLLCLTLQKEAMREAALAASIPAEACTILSVDQRAMPQWLRLVDWGLMLLNSPHAKRGSMPTKLGEFLASGVRPIQLGCNDEVRAWVRRAGSGVTLHDKSSGSLEQAARFIADHPDSEESRRGAREAASSHFSLAAGVSRYEALLKRLLRSRGS